MPSNNEYKRYFIILQEDDKGYEIASGKIPTGYAKIEIKNGRGKLTAYAQNIKNNEKADYHLLLVAPSRKAAVDMGRIMVDATGRGELNVEFDADNVMKTSMNIADFMVAAVSSKTGIPLSGYTGRDKLQWKNNYNIINKTHDRIDQMTQPIQEIVTPAQQMPAQAPIPAPMTAPMEMQMQAPMAPQVQMPSMPAMPDINMGSLVEGAKDVIGDVVEGAVDVVEDAVTGVKTVVGNVVEGAKDIAEDIYEGVTDVAQDVVQGAKGVVGGIVQGVSDIVEDVVDKFTPDTAMPTPMQPIHMPMPPTHAAVPMQPAPTPMQGVKGVAKKGGKEAFIAEVAPEAVMPAPMQPAPAPTQPAPIPTPIITPIQPPVTKIPIETQVSAAPVQPVEIPIVVKPIVEAPPVQPIMMAPMHPIIETETEVKAKFVIETKKEPEPVYYVHKPYEHHEKCEVECKDIDYKNFYYDEESERDSDSDSDSDSDDREREKNKKKDHDRPSDKEYEMKRPLMKVLERLRKYEPFEDEESREAWFKVEDDIYLLNNVTIPFMGAMMPLGYPFMMNDCVMMIGRKDYIIGVKYDRDGKDRKAVKHIMFGAPGMNNRQEEAYYRMRGFTKFKHHRSRNYGYWIMTVDARTGEIVTK